MSKVIKYTPCYGYLWSFLNDDCVNCNLKDSCEVKSKRRSKKSLDEALQEYEREGMAFDKSISTLLGNAVCDSKVSLDQFQRLVIREEGRIRSELELLEVVKLSLEDEEAFSSKTNLH